MKHEITVNGGLANHRVLGVAVLIALFVTLAAQAAKPGGGGTTPAYSYVKLGALGMPYGQATAINQAGLVVGSVRDADLGGRRAFVVVPKDTNNDRLPDAWFEDNNGDGLNDLQSDLGRPPGFPGVSLDVYAIDINDQCQVLLQTVTADSECHAFVLTSQDVNNDGKLEFFYTDGSGGNALIQPLLLETVVASPWVTAINNLGQVVGNGTVNGRTMGFVLTGQEVQLLGYQWDDRNNRQTTVCADDINDNGEIAGSVPSYNGEWGRPCLVRPRATADGPTWFVDENGDGLNDLVVKLPVTRADQWGSANGINAAGKVVGWSHLGGGGSIAMQWQVDPVATVQTTQLRGIGEQYESAMAINTHGVIVGQGHSNSRSGGMLTPRTQRALVWKDGAAKDLGSLTDQAATLSRLWMSASDINDFGAIVGCTQVSGGWPPVEPFIAVPKR